MVYPLAMAPSRSDRLDAPAVERRAADHAAAGDEYRRVADRHAESHAANGLDAVAIERRATVQAAAGDDDGRVADRRTESHAARRNRFNGTAHERDADRLACVPVIDGVDRRANDRAAGPDGQFDVERGAAVQAAALDGFEAVDEHRADGRSENIDHHAAAVEIHELVGWTDGEGAPEDAGFIISRHGCAPLILPAPAT